MQSAEIGATAAAVGTTTGKARFSGDEPAAFEAYCDAINQAVALVNTRRWNGMTLAIQTSWVPHCRLRLPIGNRRASRSRASSTAIAPTFHCDARLFLPHSLCFGPAFPRGCGRFNAKGVRYAIA